MTEFVVEPPEPVTLPIVNSTALFPVRRVFCIGRNYAEHALEMGHDPTREPPFYFLKSSDCLATSGTFPYPNQSADVHHEVELLVALGKGGSDISTATALDHVFGYGLSLDMTRRDLQAGAKSKGRPWEVGKSFPCSAPAGPLSPASEIGHLSEGRISLSVGEELRQDGDLKQMIWSVPELIAHLSRYDHLMPGDVILTGTPAGVGPVQPGDTLVARCSPLSELSVRVL